MSEKKAFWTEAKITEAAPGFGHIAKVMELDVADPFVLAVVSAALFLGNSRVAQKDAIFEIEVHDGKIEWRLRDPSRNGLVCTSGSFREDGTPICDGADDVLEIGT